MEGVDKTNMSLDDIIKMDRKKFKGKPSIVKNKNNMAKNAVKKAKNSFINRKPVNSPKKNFTIADKRQDVRSKLIKAKQMNNRSNNNYQNLQRPMRNPKYRSLNNRSMNNKPNFNNGNNFATMNAVPAFRITTKNERYQSNYMDQRGRQNERPAYKRQSTNNNKLTSYSNKYQNNQFSSSRRPVNTNEMHYQTSNRNPRGSIRNSADLSRDREYEAMARALIEAHRESKYLFNQPPSSQRRYSQFGETRGYPYRR